MRFFAALFSILTTPALAITSVTKLCQPIYPIVVGVSDPVAVNSRFQARPIVLSAEVFGNMRAVDFAARHYPPETPSSKGHTPHSFRAVDFEGRLKAFAEEARDERALTYESPLADGTKIKLHLHTGELLVVTGDGKLATYFRLPVNQRSVAGDRTTAELFSRLTGIVTAPQKLGRPPQRYSQLTAGEAVPFGGFPGPSHLETHVDKHVLGLPPAHAPLTAAHRAQAAADHLPRSEFSRLAQDFVTDFKRAAGDPAKEAAAYAKLKQGYADAAEAFMTSNRPSILTSTRVDKRMLDGKEVSQILGFRFDTLTNEVAVFDRESGKVITYFRVDMNPANKWLESKGHPPVNSPMEYFLALIKIPQSS